LRRILVTGGAGFIGSHLCKSLLAQENEVVCFDNLWTGSIDNIKHLFQNKFFKFLKGNIINKEELLQLTYLPPFNRLDGINPLPLGGGYRP
jgi:UDP-glucuronate decarboxylase